MQGRLRRRELARQPTPHPQLRLRIAVRPDVAHAAAACGRQDDMSRASRSLLGRCHHPRRRHGYPGRAAAAIHRRLLSSRCAGSPELAKTIARATVESSWVVMQGFVTTCRLACAPTTRSTECWSARCCPACPGMTPSCLLACCARHESSRDVLPGPGRPVRRALLVGA